MKKIVNKNYLVKFLFLSSLHGKNDFAEIKK